MPATKAQLRWGEITDLIAINRNADDRIIRVLEHSRDRYVIEQLGQVRHELEKERQGLLKLRDAREDTVR